jgi:phosphoribosylamine-glycine ligase
VTVKTKAPWVTGLVYTSPPFPYEDEVKSSKEYEGWPISGPILEHPDIYPIGVEKKDDKVVTTGIGLVAVVCGTGKTIKASKDAAYKTMDTLYTPYCYARTDIGDRVMEAEAELKSRGYVS